MHGRKTSLQSAVLMGSVKHTCANLTKLEYVNLRVESIVSSFSTSAINKSQSAVHAQVQSWLEPLILP